MTHGTGTKLGDPVEINALYKAFKGYTSKQGYCALTSTKTNFGHTFAASGLVSLISLVQALQHKTIPASLHCEQENEYINWKESPFYVNKVNKPWPGAANGALGNDRTRTGAVSAFGMSGTNAHMVVQSYQPANENESRDQAPCYLLAFSAKTEASLREKIKDMIGVLSGGDLQMGNLLQISYTLLTGRQHFNYRCAVVIRNREDAANILQRAGRNEKLPNLFQGKVPVNFSGQKAMELYIQELLKQKRALSENSLKYQEIFCGLADLYCQGYEIDWAQLYDDPKPRRIHLPVYPFAKEHYWFQDFDWIKDFDISSSRLTALTNPAIIHPLLQRNTSELLGTTFQFNLYRGGVFSQGPCSQRPADLTRRSVLRDGPGGGGFRSGRRGGRGFGRRWNRNAAAKRRLDQADCGRRSTNSGAYRTISRQE